MAELIEVDEDISLTPFIEAANLLVTDCCGDDVLTARGVAVYSPARLEIIERWLSAHFYAIRDPRASAEGVGSLRTTYQSKVELGLQLTHYGQQALRLDIAGGLAALDNSVKEAKTSLPPGGPKLAAITWLGTDD